MELQEEVENQVPQEVADLSTSSYEFDELGYIKDPRQVKSGEEAKRLFTEGRMTEQQAYVAKAWSTRERKGLLNLSSQEANDLYNAGFMTEEETAELMEYHNSPLKWYAKDIGKQVVGGMRDFAQESIETIDWFQRNNTPLAKTLEGLMALKGGDQYANFKEAQQVSTNISLPEVDKSHSIVGNMVRGVSQFVSGFLPATQAIKGGRLVGPMVAGGVVDFMGFDEHEARLSDLIQSVPELQNPITEFLASDKEDSKVVGKLKNTMEGAGLGVLFDGLIQGVRGIKNYKLHKANGNIDEVRAEVGVKAPEEPTVTNPTQPTKEVAEVNPSANTSVESPITDKIVTGDDFMRIVKEGMGAESKSIPPQTHQATKILADEFGLDFETIAKTHKDTEALAQRVVHARNVLNDYASQLYKEIEIFLDPTKRATLSPEEALKYTQVPEHIRALELFDKVKFHGGLQQTVRGISANIGRSLNAHKIKVGNRDVHFSHVRDVDMDDLVRSMGGAKNIRDLLEGFKKAYELDIRKVNKLTSDAHRYKLANVLHGTWLSGILSGLGTQAVNIIGNSSNIVLETAEHALAVTGRALSERDLRHFSEVSSRFKGMTKGFVDAFSLSGDKGTFWQALAKNEPVLDPRMKIEDNVTNQMPTLLSKGFKERVKGIKELSPIGQFKAVTAGLGGDILTFPLRVLSATDEAFKAVVYRADIYRQAEELANKVNFKSPQERNAFIKKVIENPTVKQHEEALDRARVTTFTTPMNTRNYIPENNTIRHSLSSAGAGVDKLASMVTELKHVPYFGHPFKYLIPFITTPLNIVKHVGRRSPLAVFSRQFHDDILAGGTRKAEALARLASGTAIFGSAYYFMEQGKMVGKIPKHLEEDYRRLGIPDYAVEVDGKWVQYNRLDPIGLSMGLVADLTTAFEFNELKDEHRQSLMADVILALMNNMVNKTYMKNVGEVINMLNDPQRYKPEKFFKNFASTFIPYSSAVTQVNNASNLYYREPDTLADYFTNKLNPNALPPKLDIFGEPIKRMERFALSINHGETNTDPVVREMFRVGANIGEVSDVINYKGVDVKLSVEEHNTYKKMIGETGIKRQLEVLINSPQYQAIQDYEVRASLIRNAMSRARQQAKNQYILKYLATDINGELLEKRGRLYNRDRAEKANEVYHPIKALSAIKGE